MDKYFEYLDNAGVKRNYDWFALNINLNFNKDEIDLDSILNFKKEFGNSDNEIIFIHEYIHFLQNFISSWGGMVFCKFTHGLYQIGASSVTDKLKLKLPIKIEVISGADLWNQGVESIDYVRNELGDNEQIVFDTNNRYPFYSLSEINGNLLRISNGRIVFTIGNRTIRESMAHIGAMLFANKTDLQIHTDLFENKSFCSRPSVLDLAPEYWILFEYFIFGGYKDVAEGVFFLCNECLSKSNPTEALIRFFSFFNEQCDSIKNETNLFFIVNIWREGIIEITAFSHTYYHAIKLLNEELKLCSKHIDHDFFNFNSNIFIRLLNNISMTYSGRSMFDKPMNLRINQYWMKVIRRFGTPIIRYKNKVPIITNQDTDLINSLTYFLGVVKTLDNLQNKTSSQCPFHSEFKICETLYKNDELCLTEPFLVRNPLKDGKECIYRNAIELMGLSDRLEL